MAKVKEKMEALVPEEEQPYPVPANWRWVRLSALYKFIDYRGSTPHKTDKGIPLITAKNVRKGFLDFSVAEYISEEEYLQRQTRGISQQGDILFTTEAPLGNVAIVDLEKYSAGQRVITFQKHQDWNELNNPFYYFFILSVHFQKMLDQQKTGSTVEGIKAEKLKLFPVPVPPFSEQKRIADSITSLFLKLDEAKEKAQAVVDGYENRKAAILHKAFTGELTEKWRKTKGITFDDWKTMDLQSVCSMKITDGTHKTPTYCEKDEGFPFLSSKDVTKGEICWDNIKYITPELHDELYKRLAPQIDDILLAKNGTTGVAAIVDVDFAFDLYVTLAVLRPNIEIVVPRYLHNIINSPICKRQFDDHLTGIGVPNLHLRDIKNVTIPVPCVDEQNEIVKIIERLLIENEASNNMAINLIKQFDEMKKSILAKAFRGELGTNDPSEEPVAL